MQSDRVEWGLGAQREQTAGTGEQQERLHELIPSYGQDLNSDPELLTRTRERSNALLGLGV